MSNLCSSGNPSLCFFAVGWVFSLFFYSAHWRINTVVVVNVFPRLCLNATVKIIKTVYTCRNYRKIENWQSFYGSQHIRRLCWFTIVVQYEDCLPSQQFSENLQDLVKTRIPTGVFWPFTAKIACLTLSSELIYVEMGVQLPNGNH